jgi:hypothetical protein
MIKVISSNIDGNVFVYNGHEYRTRMAGKHQIDNAVTAIKTLQVAFPNIPYNTVYDGIEKAILPARCELISKMPVVLLDGCHNPNGTLALDKILESCNINSAVAVVGFMADKDVIFAKPNTGESGKGIERLVKERFENLEQMYAYVTDPAHRFGVIEEQLTQHPDLSAVYPHSINSYRICTLVVGEEVHCVYAVAKFGNAGKFVDNMENDGLCCPIDQQTGKIAGCAHTSALINYDVHPYSGVKLMDYQLPFVKEAVELSKKAAMVVPEIRYIGWDVCITPNGPAIIEGNTYPGYDFWQLPEHTPDKIGLYPYFRQMVPEYK